MTNTRIPMLLAILGFALQVGCGGNWEPQPGEFDNPQQPDVSAMDSPAENEPVASTSSAPIASEQSSTQPEGTRVGGGGLLGEQMTAIGIHEELSRNLGQSGAAAQSSGQRAREAVGDLENAYGQRAEQILDTP